MSDSEQPIGRSNKKNQGVSGRTSWWLVLLTVLSIWLVVFAAIGMFGPISDAAAKIAQSLAAALNVSVTSIVVGIVVSIYATLTLLAVINPAVRKSVNSLSLALLKSEKSFHVARATVQSLSSGAISLQGGQNDDRLQNAMRNLEAKVDQLEERLAIGTEAHLDQDSLNDAQPKILAMAMEKISDDVKEGVKESLGRQRLSDLEEASLSRLSDQIVVLGSRANLALRTGILFCTAGLLILWWTLASVQPQPPRDATATAVWGDFLKVYAPRLSLVLIVEVIGFFFLKLFRAALDEVRMTQNEITNVEMKLIASHLATAECRDELPKVIHELATTERNVVIEKGQTTVELEKARGAREVEGKYVDTLLSIIKSKK